MPQWVSEVVGEAALENGERAVVYRALRSLECTSCGGAITEGALFIRRKIAGRGLPILPHCDRCAPFTLRDEKAEPRSPLIASLLAPQDEKRDATAQKPEAKNVRQASADEQERRPTDERIAHEVERRLGSVLKRVRSSGVEKRRSRKR